MWWLTRVVAKVVLFWGGRPWQGPNMVGSDSASPSSFKSIVRTGVQRAGSWLKTPSTQSLIWIAVVREIFDLGSGLKYSEKAQIE